MSEEKNEVILQGEAALAPIMTPQKLSEMDMLLKIDHDSGQFALAGDLVGSDVEAIFITSREYRQLWDADWNPANPKGGTVCCQSWNGQEAYGMGRRPVGGEGAIEQWGSKCVPQVCVHEGGIIMCESAKWTHNTKPPCLPSVKVLMFVRYDGGKWTEAVFDVSGLAVKVIFKLLKSLERKCSVSTEETKRWSYMTTLSLARPNPKAKWVNMRYDKLSLIEETKLREHVHDWALSEGIEIWNEMAKYARERMLRTGTPKDAEEAPTGDGHSKIPF